MANTLEKTNILNQIAQIDHMEQGKISTVIFKDRPAQAGPYYKLQYWKEGKNHTRYVPVEQLKHLQEAVDGYAKFQELTEQYAQLIIADTRSELQQLSTGVKKKTQHLKSSLPKTRKSSN
jgi:hypothetical protein